jgi:hypothetical protein
MCRPDLRAVLAVDTTPHHLRVGYPTIASTVNIDPDAGGSRSADNVRRTQHVLGKAQARGHRWPSVEAQQSLQRKRDGASTDPCMETLTRDRYPQVCRPMVLGLGHPLMWPYEELLENKYARHSAQSDVRSGHATAVTSISISMSASARRVTPINTPDARQAASRSLGTTSAPCTALNASMSVV